MQYSISRYLMLQNAKIQNLSDSYIMKYPERFFTTIEQRLDHNIEKIATLSNSLTRQKWDKFAALVSNLEALNPLSVMMRGFCVLTDANNKTIINSVDQLNEGMNAMIRLIDGIATCNIISKEKGTGMKTKNDNGISELKFEEAMEELETIIDRLEGGEPTLTLEESLELYKRGVLLSQHCKQAFTKGTTGS